MTFYYHANKTHFHKKGFALGLILRVRVFGTRKWPIGDQALHFSLGNIAMFACVLPLLRWWLISAEMDFKNTANTKGALYNNGRKQLNNPGSIVMPILLSLSFWVIIHDADK